MKKHKKLLIGAVLALVLIGVGLSVLLGKPNGTAVEIKRGPLVEAVYGLGTVVSNQTYNLKIGVTSTLTDVFVREGQEVTQGASLLRIDNGTLFRAPFSGTISALPFKKGETVFPQTPLLTLVDLSDRYISVSLEQEGALRVKKGQKARMSLESLRGERFEGSVVRVFPQEGQFFVHIEVSQLPAQILPGMTADVAIEVGRKDDVLMIPISGVSAGKATIIRNGKSARIPVKLGIADGQFAEVLEGDLKPGDQILIRGK